MSSVQSSTCFWRVSFTGWSLHTVREIYVLLLQMNYAHEQVGESLQPKSAKRHAEDSSREVWGVIEEEWKCKVAHRSSSAVHMGRLA